MIYPEILEKTMEYFKKLPGIGDKTAERISLSILDLTIDETEDFSELIKKCKKELMLCDICGHLSDKKNCYICEDKSRNQNLICVVEDYKSVFVFEKTGNFNGVYHVLGGLISPIDKVYPEDINISKLISRCREKKEKIEIVIALKPTIEGDATTMYIKKILNDQNIIVSRLSYGIPMGAEIDYLDTITLGRALQDRKIL